MISSASAGRSFPASALPKCAAAEDVLHDLWRAAEGDLLDPAPELSCKAALEDMAGAKEELSLALKTCPTSRWARCLTGL